MLCYLYCYKFTLKITIHFNCTFFVILTSFIAISIITMFNSRTDFFNHSIILIFVVRAAVTANCRILLINSGTSEQLFGRLLSCEKRAQIE